ncbi:MAG: saccharopine dehydrogenase family protein [Acidiferrobacter sp.]
MTKKILVLGGYGVCGSHISRVLARDPQIACVIGGRDVRRGQAAAAAIGATFVAVDIRRLAALNAALDGVFAVVNACGPFHWHDYAAAERCARRGIHYVDLADDRAYILGIDALSTPARENGAQVVSGGGSTLALSCALADTVGTAFDVVKTIDVAVLSGNGNVRGRAGVQALLYQQGTPVRIRAGAQWREVGGWSHGRTVELPAPFGRRRLYMADAPEMAIFPQRYGADVTYRTGLELSYLNRGLAALGSLSRFGIIGDLPGWAGLVHGIHRRLRRLGGTAFGLMVVMRGERDGQPLTRRAGLMAREGGLSVSCAPVVALVRKWVAQGSVAPGAGPCVGLVNWDDLACELRARNVVLQLS